MGVGELERTILGHPPGLFLLFLVEMWERFSYYGMRGLLVLYLTTPLTGMRELPPGKPVGFNPGRAWADGDASVLYGWYTGLAYLTPILGGIIADKLIGTHRSMVVGGLIIALGHVVLALSGIGDMAHNNLGMSIFILGLALIVIGTGHFKPSVSVMVGQLYKHGDPRRDGAFTIFYMGINLGAFLCAFICGTLGERVGWHWGFGSAAVGMLAGLGLYVIARPRFLSGIGLPPAGKSNIAPAFFVAAAILSALIAAFYYAGGFGAVGDAFSALLARPAAAVAVMVALAAAVLGWAVWFVVHQRPGDRGPVTAIFIFMLFNAFFWIAFEQAGTSINLFTDRNTDRMVGTFVVPTTWFQSVNAGLIFLLAPLFAWIWLALGRKKMNPSQPVKIALGLIFLGLGYVFMVIAAKIAMPTGAKASMIFIILTYFWHTVGELCLSPTGLSFVTKVAPVRFVSLLMGIWFVSSFIANLGGGLVASLVNDIETGKLELPWYSIVRFGGQADFFSVFVVTSCGAGLLILLFTPLLKMLIKGRED